MQPLRFHVCNKLINIVVQHTSKLRVMEQGDKQHTRMLCVLLVDIMANLIDPACWPSVDLYAPTTERASDINCMLYLMYCIRFHLMSTSAGC